MVDQKQQNTFKRHSTDSVYSELNCLKQTNNKKKKEGKENEGREGKGREKEREREREKERGKKGEKYK